MSEIGTRMALRWKALPGLPGEARFQTTSTLDTRHPWTEGFVVRFWNSDDSEWAGNFQGLQDWSTKVLLWPEAESILDLAMDNFYFVDARDPGNYVTLDSQLLADDVKLDANRMCKWRS